MPLSPRIPGPGSNLMTTEETWFYLGADDEQCGPVTRAQLVALVQQGHVPDAALVWRPGYEGWRPIRTVEELKATGAKSPEKAPVPRSPEPKAAPTTAALQQLLGQPREAAPKAPPPKVAASKPRPAAKRAGARKDRTPVAVGAVFAVAAVAAVAAMYRYSNPGRVAPPAAAPPVVAQADVEIPAEVPTAPPIVRVKNPFDESEVFEFPPGTPASVARDRVADILMKRAVERQKYLEARTRTTKRRT
jgi:hypothetical protein